MPTLAPRRRLLIVGLNYRPEPIGIGPYTSGLAEALAARGHAVHCIAGQPYYPDWQLFEDHAQRWASTVESGVTVTRCPHYVPANPTGARRLAHHASFAATAEAAIRKAVKTSRPDLVMAVAPSMISVPAARRAARRLGVPFWLHVQDFEVGAAMATGLLAGGGRRAGAALRFERRMLEGADMVSTISPAMRAMLIAKGMPAARVIELRNWANHADAVRTGDGTALRREWNLEGQTVVLYSGNIARKQGLEVVMDAARQLVERADIAFVVAGKGPCRDVIAALAEPLGNVMMQPLQDDAAIGALLRLADIHLLPQIDGAADLVLPSKIGNILASARPVIATTRPGSGIAQELDGCGIIVPPGDADALARAIADLADDPARRTAVGTLGAERAAGRWSKTAVVDLFESRMQALLG